LNPDNVYIRSAKIAAHRFSLIFARYSNLRIADIVSIMLTIRIASRVPRIVIVALFGVHLNLPEELRDLLKSRPDILLNIVEVYETALWYNHLLHSLVLALQGVCELLRVHLLFAFSPAMINRGWVRYTSTKENASKLGSSGTERSIMMS
jgi:hypothetical protein